MESFKISGLISHTYGLVWDLMLDNHFIIISGVFAAEHVFPNANIFG